MLVWLQSPGRKRFGGRDLDLWHWLIFEEEHYRAGLPQRVAQNGVFVLAPSLLEFGKQDRFLRRMASVDDLWCQGWSEPESGSDVASLRSHAVRDGKASGCRLSGQKCWTTRAASSTHMFGIFRTGDTAERHRGLTYFLINLDQPGVTVQPVAKIDGQPGFVDVFFDDVFVADSDVLGGVGNGWRVAMATTGSERSLSLRSPGRLLATAERLNLHQQVHMVGHGLQLDQRYTWILNRSGFDAGFMVEVSPAGTPEFERSRPPRIPRVGRSPACCAVDGG